MNAAPSRRRRRFGPGRVLRRRRTAQVRGAAGRGRPARPPADALGACAPRCRARPREHQGRVARVREDRRAARISFLRQRRGRHDGVARRAARALRRRRLHRRSADRPAPRHPGRGSARLVACDRICRLVQRPPRLPGARVRSCDRASRRDRERERRDRLRAHARPDRRGARDHRYDVRRPPRRSRRHP